MNYMFKTEIGFNNQFPLDPIKALCELENKKSEIGVECSSTITLTADNGSMNYVILEQYDIIGYKFIFLCDNKTKEYVHFCKISDYIFEKHCRKDHIIRMIAIKLMTEGDFLLE